MGFSRELASAVVRNEIYKLGTDFEVPHGSMRQLTAEIIFVILHQFVGRNRA